MEGMGQRHYSLTNRLIKILWVCFCLLVALAIIRQIRGSKWDNNGTSHLKLINFEYFYLSAYTGGLVASLSYPARSKEINMFADLIDLPEDTTVGTWRYTSIDDLIQKATDPILKVHYNSKVRQNKFTYI